MLFFLFQACFRANALTLPPRADEYKPCFAAISLRRLDIKRTKSKKNERFVSDGGGEESNPTDGWMPLLS